MKSSIVKIFILNIICYLFLLILFYVCAFLSGYGANSSYLLAEEKLFIKFIAFHTIITFFIVYRNKKLEFKNTFNLPIILILVLINVFMYVISAWKFDFLK